MTISNTKAKSVYETNGERREWEIGFDFDSNVSNLNIILEDREGYQTTVEDNYLIEDGVVIYPSLESELDPIAEGYKIILFRSTPNTQEIDLRDNVTEKGLDKLTLQVQELSEQVDRAVKVPLVEEGVNEYQDLVLKVREERDTALEQIKEATSVVSDYTQASALNVVTSKEEADRAVEASNVSVMASSDAEAFATKAENLANEAHNAVSAYVNGLGAMRNAVLDLGVFEDNQRRASSSIIDFDFEPLDVFVRFSDSEKKMWINGSHSFAGIEKVEDRKYKIFYSVSPEDFASQSAIKGPFYVQYVIKYSVFSGKPVMYRGRVDTVEQLPETAEDGDLWYVGPVEQSNKEEYIWQNGKWELLGSTDFTNIYTKEEIDNKVIVIEADIDAQADAIQKTRSDFMESDSELQQQINAHATEITTIKNDIDELGDQVAGIESKIPEGTSDTNPLINKQQLLDEEMDIRKDLNEGLSELQSQITAQASAISSLEDNVESIDKVIPASATESNQLVTGQDLLNATQDVRADFAEADSELQTQITAQASAIANKVDATGDTMTGALNLPELNVATSEGTLNLSITAGVATIATNNGLDIVSQTKFDTAPTTDDSTTWADALDTSLVRKAQVATAIAEAGGGASVPEGVYTQDNLIAGKNVTFTEVLPEGGIDEHTLACWHFDGDKIDVVNGFELNVIGNSDSNYYKFGGSSRSFKSTSSSNDISELGLNPLESSITADFWVKAVASNSSPRVGFGGYSSGLFQLLISQTRVSLSGDGWYDASANLDIVPGEDFNHYALQYNKDKNTISLFFNGKKVVEQNVSVSLASTSFNSFITYSYYQARIDELRISNIARYDGDFTPPTEPYTLATGPSKTAVNAIVAVPTKTSELENDSGFLTGLPDNVYTQSNLLGGKDIEIIPEPVEGGIDEYTLSCFHLDGTAVDEVTGYTLSPTMDNSVYKFGTGSSMWTNSTSFPWSLNSYESFSFDYWYYHKTSRSSYLGLKKTAYYTYLLGLYFNSGATKPGFYILSNKHSIDVDFEQNKWTHVYVYYNAEDRSFHLFVNGREVFSVINSTDFSGVKEFSNDGYTESRFDEIRISKCIRWTEDFEPPTQPYRLAEPTGNQVINFTGIIPSKTSELENDSNYVKNTDYAGADKVGVIRTSSSAFGTDTNSGYLRAANFTLAQYQGTNPTAFVGKGTLENIKNDLVKRGITENDIELTDEEKTSAKNWLGVSEGGSASASFPLFYHTFADHILNDASWLRGDTFSWQSGDMYVSAYNHLVSDLTESVNLYAWETTDGDILYTKTSSPAVDDEFYYSTGTYAKAYITAVDTSSGTLTWEDEKSNTGTATRSANLDTSYNKNISSSTETIGSTEITFYRAKDGHKIVLADQESKVSDIYRATGVAWYYILDTENNRFKLPRTKHAFAGLRTGVGNFVEAGLPNITGSVTDTYQMGNYGSVPVSKGALYSSQSSKGGTSQQSGNSIDINIDASRSNSTYGNSDTVQPPSTEQYLYFYVGNTVRNQTEVDIGTVTEQLNGKQDVLGNNVDYVIDSYSDGTVWYRSYKSGWLEVGGVIVGDQGKEFTFLKPFAEVPTFNLTIQTTYGSQMAGNWFSYATLTETGFTVASGYNATYKPAFCYYACGQGAI